MQIYLHNFFFWVERGPIIINVTVTPYANVLLMQIDVHNFFSLSGTWTYYTLSFVMLTSNGGRLVLFYIQIFLDI